MRAFTFCVLLLFAAVAYGQASADLAVTKTDSPDPVGAGHNLTYALTLTNNGPSASDNVSLTDATPAGTTFVSAIQTSGPAFTLSAPPVGSTGTFSASILTFSSSATATFTFVVNVNPDTPNNTTITNNATAMSAVTADPNPANNTASAATTVTGAPDPGLLKTQNPEPVDPGGFIRYTLVLTNGGPVAAQDVVVTDVIPDHVTFVSATQDSGPPLTLSTPPVGATGTFSATTPLFAAGATAIFTLIVQVDADAAAATITNRAHVSTASADANIGNNDGFALKTVGAGSAELAVTKSIVGAGPFVAGGSVTFTITVSNAGPNIARNVTATDTLPAGSTLISATPTQGTCSGTGPVVCTLGTIDAPSSASITLVLQTSPTPASQSNSVTVTATTTDPNSINNTATASFTTANAPVPALSAWMLWLLVTLLAATAVTRME